MYMRDMLAETMGKRLGIVRNADELSRGLEEIDYDLSVADHLRYDPSVMPYFNYSLTAILTLARATLTCALSRRESRGAHWRSDFPQTEEAYGAATVIAYDGGNYRVRLDEERADES
jgi:succinate dehydrogenase / fumarate reductase flavoprotein subunit